MSKQKFLVGQVVILPEPGTRLPVASVRIVGYEQTNDKPYRIGYKVPGRNSGYS